MLEKRGMKPPRVDWVWHCRNRFQIICGAIMSAGVMDVFLFNIIMAMRKLDLLEYDLLASGNLLLLRRLQNLCLYCGYNFWTEAPAKIMGFAWRVKYEYKGIIPQDPNELSKFHGVGRKILMLILQDAFLRDAGIVADRHVSNYSRYFRWTNETKPDKIAEDIESWMPEDYYRPFNESIGGINQLWRDKNNQQEMMDAADSLGEGWRQLVLGVISSNK